MSIRIPQRFTNAQRLIAKDPEMVEVAILGATGYTALELIKILLRHPQAKITALTTRQEGSPPIHAIHQSLAGRLELKCEDLSPAEVAKRAEVVFCCLPHVASMQAVPTLLDGGCRVALRPGLKTAAGRALSGADVVATLARELEARPEIAAEERPGNQTESDLDRAITLIEQTGAMQETMARARAYADIAKAALKVMPESDIKHALADIADFCVERAY
jgi:hypothetical protein